MYAFATPPHRSVSKRYGIIDKGNGEVLLLLHGLFGALSNWNHVIKAFSPHYRVVIPSLPVYDNGIGDANLENLLEYVEEVVYENYIGENITIIGNSLGGHLALMFALKHPEKVKRLVLTGSSGLYENTMGSSFVRVKNYEFIKEKVEYTFYKKEVVTKALVDEVYETAQSIEKTMRIIRLARSAQKNNLALQLRNIKAPTLLVWGFNDLITPPDVAYKFSELIPHTELKMIAECGHVPMMEHPKLFNKYLKTFLEKHPLTK